MEREKESRAAVHKVRQRALIKMNAHLAEGDVTESRFLTMKFSLTAFLGR
jgi:hypothetical protein